MSTAHPRLDLLLACDDGRPALEDGLPGESAQRAAKQVMPGHDKRLHGGDAGDLPTQGWGIVAPEGPEGDRMLEAIQPLRKLREDEQGTPARIFRVPPSMAPGDANRWKLENWGALEPEDQPYYLMLLGDAHHTPIELQHVLANDALVGRVHFAASDGETDLGAYAAYADKVVRYAWHATRESAADLLYYVAPDGSEATVAGRSLLVEPSLARSRKALADGKSKAADVRHLEAETVDELLEGAKGARPSVMLSVSHGLGAPRRGWSSNSTQWQRQGALVLKHEEILDAERLQGQVFLPGGMWFFLACFGMGTPKESVYLPWLSRLREADEFGGSLSAVLHSLPRSDERGFIAALPQAALANPQGPLAIIGHIDLAWTYAFTGGTVHGKSREDRIRILLNMLVRGDRAGVALNKLMDDYKTAQEDVMGSYSLQEEARVHKKPDPIPPATLAHQWMLRNDLRGYVLLGDPAVRLPLQQYARRQPAMPVPPEVRTNPTPPEAHPRPTPPEEHTGPAPTITPALASATTLDRERFVVAMLRGDEAPRAIAERAGVSLETLWRWVDHYRAGGRAGLGDADKDTIARNALT